MRKLFTLGVVLLALSAVLASAQTIPINNPIYLPGGQKAAVAIASTASFPQYVTYQTNGASVVALRVTGTLSGFAATVEGSNDNTNWTTLNVYPAGGGAASNALSAVGFWRLNVAGYTQVRVNMSALSSGTATIRFTSSAVGNLNYHAPFADPCSDPNVVKSSAVLSGAAASTTELVALAAGKTVYVCNITASLEGTTPDAKFVTGTGTACATGSADLTAAFKPTSGSILNIGWGGTVFKGAAASAVCVTTTGTGSAMKGVITYVQQ